MHPKDASPLNTKLQRNVLLPWTQMLTSATSDISQFPGQDKIYHKYMPHEARACAECWGLRAAQAGLGTVEVSHPGTLHG
jgi:hypothetical protein